MNWYITSAMYYDYRGLVVQSRSTNHLGGNDIVYNHYDFTGKILNKKMDQNIAGQPVVSELYAYTYDKAGRLLNTSYTLGSQSAIVLTANSYDELGRLTSKKRHNQTDEVDYAYNVRNWTTKITDGGFVENLYYNSNPLNTGLCYNGNISYSNWTYGATTTSKGYLYNYDKLNRLIDASFQQETSAQLNGSFNEHFGYDKHGNINILQRKKDNVLIDDLTLHYDGSGNQVKSIDDGGINQNQYLVKEYIKTPHITKSGETDFTYDANGNVIKDLDRDIVTIKYNVLNLPDLIQFSSGHRIENLYAADGRKLETKNFTKKNALVQPLAPGSVFAGTPSDFDLTGTEYLGNFKYDINGAGTLAISRIENAEGYYDNARQVFMYNRKDHLGNIREVWNASTKTTDQRTQYYPSGLPMASTVADNSSLQSYKYNGKEFVEMHGLDTYDYGARGYNPSYGRFTSVDPLAEKYYSLSPYAYCLDNPMRFIDPDGRLVVFASGVSEQFKQDYKTATEALKSHDSGGFINTLEDSKNTYTIKESSSLESSFSGKNNTVTWSSNAMLLTTNGTSLSATSILNHELDHAAQKDKNPDQQKQDGNTKSTNFGNKEEERVIKGSEQQTAKNLGEIKEGETTRTDHGGTLHKTNSPTSTETINTPIVTAPKKEETK
jgi:RHS repeat-associated protein